MAPVTLITYLNGRDKMNGNMRAITLIGGMLLAGTGCSETGTDPVSPAPSPPVAGVSVAADRSTASADDLRGLTYARVGANAGKIYASGHVGSTPATRQAVVARFNADGSPDTTFGGDGFVELEATTTEGPSTGTNNDETSLGIAELQSGDVVVAVNAAEAGGGQSIYLFRLTPNGDKRAGWGDADGKVEVVFGNAASASDTAWDVHVDRSVPTDRVVVSGFGSAPNGSGRTDNDRYVTRLVVDNTSAVPDPAFNGGNAFNFNVSGTLTDNARRSIVEADGKIVQAGYTGDSSSGLGNTVVLFRLTNTGTLDPTFGNFSTEPTIAPSQGVAVFNPFKVDGGAAECYAVGKQTIGLNAGKYVTTGYGGATTAGTGVSTLGYQTTGATSGQDLVTFRVSGGTATAVDTTWGNQGHLAIQSEGQRPPNNEERGRHLVVLPDDRIIQVGRYDGSPAAYVLNANGGLSGILELPAPVNSQFFTAALSQDGRRVAMSTNADTTAAPAGGARLVILQVN
jgi:uncharacterized delta-60 repeat protein